MTDDLRHRLARALADHAQQDRGLDADQYGPENWLCCAGAVIAVLDPAHPAVALQRVPDAVTAMDGQLAREDTGERHILEQIQAALDEEPQR